MPQYSLRWRIFANGSGETITTYNTSILTEMDVQVLETLCSRSWICMECQAQFFAPPSRQKLCSVQAPRDGPQIALPFAATGGSGVWVPNFSEQN
jgi:hypothetical protein